MTPIGVARHYSTPPFTRRKIIMDDNFDDLPNVRDGLNRKERIILHCIHVTQKELGGRNVPTAMLYGRVLEFIDISVDELQAILQRLATKSGGE